MNWKVNDSDVGYYWDDQWNIKSDEKEQRDKGGEASSPDDKEEDDLS